MVRRSPFSQSIRLEKLFGALVYDFALYLNLTLSIVERIIRYF